MAQIDRTTMTQAVRKRFTAAEVKAGAEILAAVPGMAYRLVDFTMIAIGGAATTATSVDILGTRSAASVRPFVVATGTLLQSVVVKPNSANVTVLADGASHTALDVGTAVTIGQQAGGSDLGGASHIDVVLIFTAEAA